MPRYAAPILLYAVLAILVVPVYPHFVSPNEFSRWVLAVAIADSHSVEVTQVVRSTQTQNEDLASVDGRLYSNKAPGATLVGLPAYRIARLIAGPSLRATINAMRLLASSVPAILLAIWLATLAKRFGCSEKRSTFAVTVLLFGTPLFAYGLLFFAHALSAFTLFGAFALLFASSTEARGPRPEAWWAGALLGLAIITEYPNVIPAAVLIACALPRLRMPGSLRLIAGGLPFAIILAVYNRLAFGSVFALSAAHESNRFYRELASGGLFGVGLPSPAFLLRLLFDPAKGLFVFSPVLVVAFLGLRTASRALPRATFIALVATPLSILLTFSGYPNWYGGWTVGARYLVPALPFLALLIAFALETWFESLLLGASILAIAMVTLVFPFAGPEFPAPWTSFALPMLRDGHVMPNLLHLVWLPLAIVVPFAIVAIAAVTAVPRRHIALLLAGGIASLVAGIPFIGTARNIRAVVEEVHFEDRTAIERALPVGDRNAAALEAIARRREGSPPDFWPR